MWAGSRKISFSDGKMKNWAIFFFSGMFLSSELHPHFFRVESGMKRGSPKVCRVENISVWDTTSKNMKIRLLHSFPEISSLV